MSGSPALSRIKGTFDTCFATWEIVLPAEDLAEMRPGSIASRGWTINDQFGIAEGIPYLEYFASHRMTNDTLNRIYADGRQELVGYCQEFFAVDDPQAEAAYHQHNRHFYQDVARRGLS